MRVSEIMNREVKTVRPEQSLADVARLFVENHIHGAPVVDAENRLVGIVTESDILNATKAKYIRYNLVYPSIHQFGLDFKENYSEIARAFEEVKSVPVSEIMTRKVVAVAPGDSVEEVASMMVRKKINRVPVVERGKVVGILTRGDILRGLFRKRE
ncbi:MAG: CBS domain-containing protein [Thermoplasmata archaeon]